MEYGIFDIFLDSVCCYFVNFLKSVNMRVFSTVSFLYYIYNILWWDFPGGASGKEPPHPNAGSIRDTGSIPGLEKSPGGRYGNPL